MALIVSVGLGSIALGSIALTPALARAQDESDLIDPSYSSEVRAERPPLVPIDSTPGFAVAIDAEETTARLTSVSQLIERSPGVSSRNLGGLGGFATVSVRGSAANQVLVLLDGVPLNTASVDQVDINSVVPDLLDRLEVYRSGAPLWLGAAPMGGVVNLVTREEAHRAFSASASYGSYHTRKASIIGATPILADPAWDVLAGVVYRGSAGDFSFHDDRGTPYNTADDAQSVRRNNAFDRGDWLFRSTIRPARRLTASVVESGRVESRGVPGLGQHQGRRARLDSVRSISQVSVDAVTWPFAAADTHARLAADVQRSRFTDTDGEIGLGRRDLASRGEAFGGQLRLGVFPLTPLTLGVAGEGRWERFVTEDRLAASAPRVDADRATGSPSLALDLDLLDHHLLVTGGLRGDFVASRFGDVVPFSYSSGAPASSRRDAIWSAQTGLRVSSSPSPLSVSLHGTFGRFARVPTLLEMFGDTGAVIGNDGLAPEESVGADAGVTTAWARPGWEGTAVLAAFAYRYDNLIQFVQNSQGVARPENIASARVRGLELGTDGQAPPIQWSVAYTLIDAIDTSRVVGQAQRPLPGRPTHALRAALGAGVAGFEAEYSLDVESRNTLDRAGFRVVPRRIFHGLRAAYTPPWLREWTLTLEADNLFDYRVEEVPVLPSPPGVEITSRQAVSDYFGFPLPGRTVFATLRWEPDLED